MLQRAASNAYSWWAAGHIRTKQSKWLEQSLQDMQEKVECVVKLIEEDGDSFAKRAEMYYKKRPELINFVEESYRAYRALAERYDHLSKELQAANNTIATCFPEQIQLAMDEEDEYGVPKMPKNFPQNPTPGGPNIPKVPKAPIKNLKGLITTASKKLQGKKADKKEDASKEAPKSGLTKNEALGEIDKLQKDILALQTVKEFVKSSYESGLAKYSGVEKQITEMQQKICRLEDEFGAGRVIEDDEARTLMAEAALKSCQETLTQLQEKQERSTTEASREVEKIEDARKKLKSFKQKYLGDQIDEAKPAKLDESAIAGAVAHSPRQKIGKEIEQLQDEIMGQHDASSVASLTVTQMAERIDELVNKVVSLETAVSSQTALIDRLRTEADDLQTQVRILEDGKAALRDDKHNLKMRVTAVEEKLQGIQDLKEDVENQNSSLRTDFAEARTSLDHLAEKLSSVKPDDDGTDSSQDEDDVAVEIKSQEDPEKQKGHPSASESPKNLTTVKTEDKEVRKEQGHSTVVSNKEEESRKTTKKLVKLPELTPVEKVEEVPAQSVNSVQETQPETNEDGNEVNSQKMMMSGLEDKENVPLTEYNTVLRNYKEVKKKLSDKEKQERDTEFEVTLQMRELKSAIAKRDEEIHSLHAKLCLMQENMSESKELKVEKLQASDPSEVQRSKSMDLAEGVDKDNPIVEIDEDDIKMMLIDKRASPSPVEEKLRMEIDAILDENLSFWLRFSSAFHQIQKFKTTVQDLQDEISKLREKETQESNNKIDMKSEIRPIYKHMREIQNELTVWLEQSLSLKDELKRRFSSLCSIQEEITKALKEGVEEEDIRFSSHQAARFQGEVLNMKQENNKVREELEAGVDHVTTLQVDIGKTVRTLEQEFGLAGNQLIVGQSSNRSQIPLRSFIFGTKVKKQKRSVFACINNKKYQVLRAGVPL